MTLVRVMFSSLNKFRIKFGLCILFCFLTLDELYDTVKPYIIQCDAKTCTEIENVSLDLH